jgi:hypothetical protein
MWAGLKPNKITHAFRLFQTDVLSAWCLVLGAW